MAITEQMQALLDVVSAARSLTVILAHSGNGAPPGYDVKGCPVIGYVGWYQLQAALAKLQTESVA